jgi:hypothetical protein
VRVLIRHDYLGIWHSRVALFRHNTGEAAIELRARGNRQDATTKKYENE